MKKICLYVCISLLSVCYFSACNSANFNEEYFYQINTLIKDDDFSTAKVEDYKIILYNSQNEPQKEIMFDDYSKNIQLVSVRKCGSIVYFITGGSVDDEQGVIFINDESNRILDGIKTLKRIGGNSYQYNTSE